MPEPAWKAYERQIYESLKQGAAANAEITFDSGGRQRLPGRFSGIDRQVDVLVRGQIAGLGRDRIMVVDCKHWKNKIDVGDVDAFVGFLLDVRAPLGVLVTTSEWTPAARNRALAQNIPDIDVDVVPFVELAVWRPRNPTIATTAGTNLATCSYWADGELHTEIVSPDLARRLIEERERGETPPDSSCFPRFSGEQARGARRAQQPVVHRDAD